MRLYPMPEIQRDPLAHTIAAQLDPVLLGLRTRRLAADIAQVKRVSYDVARRAVAIARKQASPAKGEDGAG